MTLKRILAILVSLFCLIPLLQAQTPDSLVSKLKREYARENIFVHYDKTDYRAGDTIFYKAYIMEGYRPSVKSSVLYVELIDENGKAIIQQMLPVMGSSAVGSISLADSMPQAKYRIKAFTERMRNFGVEGFYQYPLMVLNASKTKNIPVEEHKYTVQFLPEGGELVAKMFNRVAFICTDQWGTPSEFSGIVQDDLGNEVASFSTTHHGMGTFDFIPLADEKYTAKYTVNNQPYNTILPTVKSTGVVLSVRRKNEKAYFEVTQSAYLSEAEKAAYLLAVADDAVVFKIELTNRTGSMRGAIPEQNLPTGILQLTVFNAAHMPLAERLVFVNSEDHLIATSLDATKKDLEPRRINDLSLRIPKGTIGSFSVAITDAGDAVASAPARENILSRFLLSNDIKGEVYDAPSYFKSNTAADKENLDLVMLTHGWRKYSWKELLSKSFPSMAIKDPNFISVSGVVYKPNSKEFFPNAELTAFIMTKDSGFNMLQMQADEQGRFDIPGMVFNDTATITFKNNSTKKYKTFVYLHQSKFPEYKLPASKYAIPEDEVARYTALAADQRYGGGLSGPGKLLNAIVFKVKAKSPKEQVLDRYTGGIFGANASSTLDLINEPPAGGNGINILDYLRNRLPSVNIGLAPGYFINYRQTSNMSGPIAMQLLINGRVTDPSEATLYNASDIALVQVFSISPNMATGGMLAIYTKKGDDLLDKNVNAATSTFDVRGFSTVKEFFSPNYSKPEDKKIADDRRSTLYWNPYVIADGEKDRLDFNFYNSDIAKKYKVIIEGMTEEGKLIHIEQEVE